MGKNISSSDTLPKNGGIGETSTSLFPSNVSILILIFLSTCIYFLVRRNPRLKYHMGKFPNHLSCLPVLGHAHHLLRPHEEFMTMFHEWADMHDLFVVPVWLTNWLPYAVVLHPIVAEKIMSTMSHAGKGRLDYVLLHNWLGEGLLTASLDKWTKRRKLLTPAFHFNILETFLPIFNEQASILVDCLKKELDTGAYFDVYPYLGRCTLDVICETAMGKKMNAQKETSANKEYIEAVNGISDLLLDKLVKPWLRIPLISYSTSKEEWKLLNVLHGFTDKVIQTRKAERLTETSTVNETTSSENIYFGKKRKAFLDLLLDFAENEKLTDKDIREEVDTFMFEGHDTTGVNLGWTVLMLAMHPECQRLVHAEIDEVLGDDPTRDLTSADVSKMKYMELCIKETLRLYPSVPFITRHIDSDIVLDNDSRIIPGNVTAMIPIYFLHRHPDYYNDPDLFIPERHLDDGISNGETFSDDAKRARKTNPFSFVPFSAGPRNCIGQKFALLEEKIILAKFFQRYRAQSKLQSVHQVKTVPHIVLRPTDGYIVKLFQR